LRSSREALIPLWGDHLGITPATIPLVFAASAAVESLFFYPVGMVMDRKGRKWAAVPATALLSLGIAAIPITSDLASLTVVALVMGLANGLGSGMNMTLGSDLSPLAGRSRFLGVWRLVSDLGTVGGPLLVAVTTSVATLGAAALMVGGVGAAGVLVLWRLVPETLGREVPGG
jgi:MFS family permease